MVIHRARSSGALSIEAKLRNSASPLIASVFVIAAVSVVFPWSTCPIVPTLMCGFVRSNFFFAMAAHSSLTEQFSVLSRCVELWFVGRQAGKTNHRRPGARARRRLEQKGTAGAVNRRAGYHE